MTETTSDSNEPWQLIATGDWLSGRSFKIHGHCILGRDASCDIIIPGTHLSRRHAEIAIQGDSLLVRDLGSANGTFFNDQRIEQVALKPGDKIRFDVLTFKVAGPSTTRRDVTQIRRVEHKPPAQKKARPAAMQNAVEQRRAKPTSFGNRHITVQMTAAKKAFKNLSTVLAVLLTVGVLAGIAFLLTQL